MFNNNFALFVSSFQCNDNCKQFRQVVCQDDRHHANITNCPLNTRPHSVQECCNFKWRNLWTPVKWIYIISSKTICLIPWIPWTYVNFSSFQCSAECGNGTRSRRRVCMRIFMRNPNQKPPARKRGQAVNERYCQHMKQPPFIPKTRPCRKQICAAPKWEPTAWTRVNSTLKTDNTSWILFNDKSIFPSIYSVRLVVAKGTRHVKYGVW